MENEIFMLKVRSVVKIKLFPLRTQSCQFHEKKYIDQFKKINNE